MEKTKKFLKFIIALCIIALIITPIVALSDFDGKPGEKSGLTLSDAREKILEIAQSTPVITDENRIILRQIYEDFGNNSTISTIYNYCYANEYYYKYYTGKVSSASDASNRNANLKNAKATIEKINKNYSGSLSDEISELTEKIEDAEPVKYNNPNSYKPSYSSSNNSKQGYSSLTPSDKANIRKYIQERYDYYDKKEGGYSGDKYSDQIWREVMNKYGITESEVTIIWAGLD